MPGGRRVHQEETSMARIAHGTASRRLRLAVAGAVALTALTAATASAAMPPSETAAPGRAAPEAGFARSTGPSGAEPAGASRPATRPLGPFPGYVLERGRYNAFDAPEAGVSIVPFGSNVRGQIAGTTTTDRALGGARGFLLAKGVNGPFTPVDFPGAPRTQVGGIDDLGRVVGRYENPAATPPQQQNAGMPAAGTMAALMAGG
jgi:hypothetical protein